MIKLKTQIPGPYSAEIISAILRKNGGQAVPYPFVQSGKGKGAYCQDIDGNVFLDFASQIATCPLGYNHPDLLEVIRSYKQYPIKFAGQEFNVEEHLDVLEALTDIAPRQLNAAFLINSGAEAVENAIKICMRNRPATKFGISMEGAFHGRTLGALSCTNSKQVHKKNFLSIPMKRLPYDESAPEKLERIINNEAAPKEIGFVILECVQGEGGYNIAPKEMVKGLRKLTAQYNIPLICDEIQAGLGRTGKWWSFQNFGITPEVFSSAKALQVGATVANKNFFPKESGSISTTWGGGAVLDMALGAKIIQIIKRKRLVERNNKTGKYILKGLLDIKGVSSSRGLGLMLACDLPTAKIRDKVVIECAKNGLILLGCGERSIRVIPPYIIKREDSNLGVQILEKAVKDCSKRNFRHSGKICRFMGCGSQSS